MRLGSVNVCENTDENSGAAVAEQLSQRTDVRLESAGSEIAASPGRNLGYVIDCAVCISSLTPGYLQRENEDYRNTMPRRMCDITVFRRKNAYCHWVADEKGRRLLRVAEVHSRVNCRNCLVPSSIVVDGRLCLAVFLSGRPGFAQHSNQLWNMREGSRQNKSVVEF